MLKERARPDYLTVQECADKLNVTKKTVYTILKEEQIPHLRLRGGQTIRVNRDAFEDWIEGRTTSGM